MTGRPIVLDSLQLKRIEAVYRGFLYQHFYAAGCLLFASGSGFSAVIVAADEDIEIALPDRHIYVQVKTRSEPLTEGDIEGANRQTAPKRAAYAVGVQRQREKLDATNAVTAARGRSLNIATETSRQRS